MVALYETYRPKDFTQVVGQPNAINRLLCVKRTVGLEGQVFWMTGNSGTGKTTLARLIADNVADHCTTYEVDAQDVSMDMIRDWEAKAQYRSLYGGYAFIVNEAHGLSNKAVSRLQTVLEDKGVQNNTTWIFTTTNEGEQKLFGDKFDACPFLSRAICIELESGSETIVAMAKRLHEIAELEEVNGKPFQEYLELINSCGGNMRQALQKIASGVML